MTISLDGQFTSEWPGACLFLSLYAAANSVADGGREYLNLASRSHQAQPSQSTPSTRTARGTTPVSPLRTCTRRTTRTSPGTRSRATRGHGYLCTHRCISSAFAIAYKSDISQVQFNDLVVFSLASNTPWRRVQKFEVPQNMPACPSGGCICAVSSLGMIIGCCCCSYILSGDGVSSGGYSALYSCKAPSLTTKQSRTTAASRTCTWRRGSAR